MTRRQVVLVVLCIVAVAAALLVVPRTNRKAEAAPARVNGAGSTYVALAMQQWVADGQTSGLQVNYLPTGSPDGLSSYGNGLIDFAGTEAEFSALTSGGGGGTVGDRRGYQYVPDVAGATAVMYNVDDRAGRKVDYLHLSRRTIARIFTGDITNWSDPAITDDNKGLVLPDQPITVVYRSGQSGTTALFYDFVSSVAPDIFSAWAGRHGLPTNVRIIQLDGTPGFAPKTLALNGSDQIAQFVAGGQGKWSIAYDEFGYAVTYGAPAAWVQNASGNFVQPYAANISAALEAATLRPDLSQELSGVYNSGNPDAYPISAYSYMVTQCAPQGDRPTCKAPYDNSGVTETMARWMRYIACEGQVNMARIGYSPLPPVLSQEVANSIARMQGTSPETLTVDNCANPRFAGNLGLGSTSPPDPLAGVSSLAGDQQVQSSGGTGPAAAAASASGASSATDIAKKAVGGSGKFQTARPVAYNRGGPIPSSDSLPLIAFLILIAVPPVIASIIGRNRRRAREATE